MEYHDFGKAAELLKVSRIHLEDCLQENKIYCSIRLGGDFVKVKGIGNSQFTCNASRTEQTLPSSIFTITNYSEVFPDDTDNPFNPQKLEELHLNNDGFDYYYRGNTESMKKSVLRISQEEIDRFKAEKGKVSATDEEVNPREKKSLLDLVAVLADRYKYDPESERNDAPQMIANKAATLGRNINEKTVRKHLKAATEKDPEQE